MLSITENPFRYSQSYNKAAYYPTFDMSPTLVGNIIVDHWDVVGASHVGAAPATYSFSTELLASMVWTKTAARRNQKHLNFGIWYGLY